MNLTVADAARFLRESRRPVFLCGAGLSVPSGIRAYRTGPDAVWSRYVKQWGTLQKFKAEPLAWWKEFWLELHGDLFKACAPNPGHEALVAAMARWPEGLVITQNIDGLHRRAGHPEGQLIEVHGRHDRFFCAGSGACEAVETLLPEVDLSALHTGVVPRCAACAALLRPLVLLFDESYDSHPAYQAHRARRALNDADLIVFVGTSFSVGITSSAIRAAEVSRAPLINLNVEPAPAFGALHSLIGGAEQVLPQLISLAA